MVNIQKRGTMTQVPKQLNALRGVTAVVGNYGSGKTEISINLALYLKHMGLRVSIADLDLVNPYFRTREARLTLQNAGINTLLPPDKLLEADLPIVTPQILGKLRAKLEPEEAVILDIGGDPAGATVLASLAGALAKVELLRTIQIVNIFRPYTSNVAGCLDMRAKIEKASQLKVTHWAVNAHLLHETAPQHIMQGYNLGLELEAATGLPLLFVAVTKQMLPLLAPGDFKCPLLVIERKLGLPWDKKPAVSG